MYTSKKINITITGNILSLVLLASGCDSDLEESHDTEMEMRQRTPTPESLPASPKNASYMAVLRVRIDAKHSAVKMPNKPYQASTSKISLSEFTSQLESETNGRPDFVDTQVGSHMVSNARFIGKSHRYDVSVNHNSHEILVRDNGHYRPDIEAGYSNEHYRGSAEGLLRSIGARVDEADIRVENLGRASMTHVPEGEDAVAGLPERIGKKVFARRVINGIPVPKHRAVLSYNLDGRLRKMRAKWPSVKEIRKGGPRFINRTEDEVFDMALEVLAKNDVPANGAPIYIGTFYDEIDSDESGAVLKLRGAVVTQSRGPNGDPLRGRGIRMEFDMEFDLETGERTDSFDRDDGITSESSTGGGSQ